MNRIRCLSFASLLLFGASFTSCAGENKTLYLNANYIYNHLILHKESKEIPVAALMFNNSNLGKGLESVEKPMGIIAGDCLKLTYTGNYYIQESYPGTIVLEGRVKSYEFFKTDVEFTRVTDGYITESNFTNYVLESTNVIINKSLEFEDLNDLQLKEVYYSIKYVHADPDDTKIYGPQPKVISALYTFDPRTI